MPPSPAFHSPSPPDARALRGGRGGGGAAEPLALVRYLDLLLVVLAAPFVVVAGLPVLGYACAAAVWIVTRLVGDWIERRARASGDLRTHTALAVASLMVRAWLAALTILAVGLAASRADGATAAVTVLAAFTVYFVMSLMLRPERESSTS